MVDRLRRAAAAAKVKVRWRKARTALAAHTPALIVGVAVVMTVKGWLWG
jgi:hypothetical protein